MPNNLPPTAGELFADDAYFGPEVAARLRQQRREAVQGREEVTEAELAWNLALSAIATLSGCRDSDPFPVLMTVAAVDEPSRRSLLTSRLAALNIPGLTKAEIEKQVSRRRSKLEVQRKAVAEAERRSRLLALDVDGAKLITRLASFILRFVVLSPAQAAVAALWVVHTHAVEAAEYTPYLHITAPEKRCGKSRLLEVLEVLVARPMRVDSISTAALMRSAERDVPTVLMDEADAAFGKNREFAQALRGLLNSGFRRGGCFRLCVGDNHDVHDFPTFCPKAIAGIGKLPDTVADRSVAIHLKRKARGETVARFCRRDAEKEGAGLREQCEAWMAQNIQTLKEARPAMPEVLGDRQTDICEPLLAIADTAGGEWPTRARRALVELATGECAEDDSIGVRLLADVRAIFNGKGADRLPSKELAEALAEVEASPWPEWRGGKPITPNQLARQLDKFGIEPRTIRLASGPTCKGYPIEQFRDAWERYLSPAPLISAPQSVTPSQTAKILSETGFPIRSPEYAVTGGKCGEKPHEQRTVTPVPVLNAENGKCGVQPVFFAPLLEHLDL